MRFLKHWLSINPTELKILDLAYLSLLLPLLFILKLPMVIFFGIVLTLIIIDKKPTVLTLLMTGLLGIIAIFFSLYGSFNFTGLSRLKLFVELLIYLLILAVSLQRLTGTVNIYLKVSPVLLLALSLFFFNSLPMLLYVIIEVFILSTLLLWQIMQTPLHNTLKISGIFYLASLPIVVLFFIFFPRISFEHASYGFKEDIIHRTGHDGLMHLDNNALLVPSKRIVMEVGFQGTIPPAGMLYFRGSVLYTKQAHIWKPLPRKEIRFSRPVYTYSNIVYKVTLYPTDKRWLYLLDIPLEIPNKTTLDNDLETTVDKPLKEPLLYTATSSLQSSYAVNLPEAIKKASLAFDSRSDPKTQKIAQTIRERYAEPKDRLEAVKTVFKTQRLTYTLKPAPFDLNNSTDSFLFDQKKGYCVHFAAAFVTLCRMTGIPARIVTGYKSDGADSVENYLIVRESDAHAWAEVYLQGRWQRVETTSFAVFSESSDLSIVTQENSQLQQKTAWNNFTLYLHYFKYQIDTWILEYSALSQKRLFSYLKKDTLFLISFLSGIAALIALVSVLGYLIARSGCKDALICILAPLLKILEKKSPREPSESLNAYFVRLEKEYGIELSDINILYHNLRYRNYTKEEDLLHFKNLVSNSLKLFKHSTG